jgi:hypothetical protein
VNDPNVANLVYRFRSTNELDRFTAPTPLDATIDGFDVHLDDGVLTATPHDHFASADDAREILEPQLRDWEAQARVQDVWHSIRFDFEDAQVIDRSPGPGVEVYPTTARGRVVAFDAVIMRDNSVYPPPATGFRTDPVVDAILGRLDDLDQRRTTLTDAANWVLTKVEDEFGRGAAKGGRRKQAARNLVIGETILSNLGRLAEQNDPKIGRKANRPVKPFTDNERVWMRAAIVLVARRIGERNAGGPLGRLTMSDLPAIP